MKVLVERSLFLSALSHVQNVVEKRNITPILANVLLETKKEALRLTTTDLDLVVHESIAAKIEEEGSTTVNVQTLYDIVRKLPDGSSIELKWQKEKNTLVLKCGPSKFNLPTLPAEEFTILKASDLPHKFTVNTEEIRHLINQTRFAMAPEDARYYLNGIYLHTLTTEKGSFLRAVATDGLRLALAEIREPEGTNGMPGIIVPRKAVTELSRLIDGVAGQVSVSLSLTQISFELPHTILVSRLIDGTFPNYEEVIPYNNSHELMVKRGELTGAVDRVALVLPERTKGIKFILERHKLTLSAVSPEMGSALEEIQVEYSGPRIETGFNARYLLDALTELESENVSLTFEDETAPTIIRGADEEDLLFVLMPMRI